MVRTTIGTLQIDNTSNSFIELKISSILNKIGYTQDMDQSISTLLKSVQGKKQHSKTFDNDDQRKLDYIVDKYKICFFNPSKKTSFEGKMIRIFNITDKDVPLLLPIPSSVLYNNDSKKHSEYNGGGGDNEGLGEDGINSTSNNKRKLPARSESQGYGRSTIISYGKIVLESIQCTIRDFLHIETDINIKTHRGALDILDWVVKHINKEFLDSVSFLKASSTVDLDKAIVDAAVETFQFFEVNGLQTAYLQHFKSLIIMSLFPQLSINSFKGADFYRRLKISKRLALHYTLLIVLPL